MSLTLKFYAGNYGIYHKCAEKNDIFSQTRFEILGVLLSYYFIYWKKNDQNFSRILLANYIGNVILEIYELNNNGYYYLS